MKRCAVVVAPALVALSVVLAGCGSQSVAGDSPSEPATSPSSATSSSSPTPDESSGSGSSMPAQMRSVPIYYATQTPQGMRLAAEKRPVELDDLADATLAEMSATPFDPDYTALVPDGGQASVDPASEGSALIIDLGEGSTWTERGSLTKPEAELAAQSVLWTMLAESTGPSMRLYAVTDGEPTTLFGLDTEKGIAKADFLDVAALVNLFTPGEGDVVDGPTLKISGLASSFEATVPWTITDSSGTVVDQGSAKAEGWLDALYPFKAAIDVSGLAPGSYTVTVSTDDPSEGEGGGPHTDTRTFEVG